jgi:hypothetical protein
MSSQQFRCTECGTIIIGGDDDIVLRTKCGRAAHIGVCPHRDKWAIEPLAEVSVDYGPWPERHTDPADAMSLRDFFAASALSTASLLCGNITQSQSHIDAATALAYEIADSMLERRKR